MTEQIERVEEAAERAETAPRERTGYDARAAQDRWQAFWEADKTFVPADDGSAMVDVTLLRLRALLARANGDDSTYCDYRDRYRAMATELGFEGHIAWAEAMIDL